MADEEPLLAIFFVCLAFKARFVKVSSPKSESESSSLTNFFALDFVPEIVLAVADFLGATFGADFVGFFDFFDLFPPPSDSVAEEALLERVVAPSCFAFFFFSLSEPEVAELAEEREFRVP